MLDPPAVTPSHHQAQGCGRIQSDPTGDTVTWLLLLLLMPHGVTLMTLAATLGLLRQQRAVAVCPPSSLHHPAAVDAGVGRRPAGVAVVAARSWQLTAGSSC